MIKTVTGNIEASQLGKVFMHEHLYADLSGVRHDEDSVMTDVNEIVQELQAATADGIKTIVDVSCLGMGRDPRKLQAVSKAANVNVVAATGYYLAAYYPESVAAETDQEIADRFIADIEKGMDGTDIKAGIIGEIATGKNEFTEDNKKVFRAAAKAHRKTGVPVTTHCSAGTMAYEQAMFLINEGVDRKKLIIGHLDLLDDRAALMKVLQTGVTVGFDTIGKNGYRSNESRVANLVYLIEQGYVNQIILSEDISRKSYYQSRGGHGYGYLTQVFLPELRANGVSETNIEQLLIKNPAAILDVSERYQEEHQLSERVSVLVEHGAVLPRAAVALERFLNYVNAKNPISKSHSNYDMFETHLIMAMNRLVTGQPMESIPDNVVDEISNSQFADLAIAAMKSVCELEQLQYSEEEAMYLGLYLMLLLKEDAE